MTVPADVRREVITDLTRRADSCLACGEPHQRRIVKCDIRGARSTWESPTDGHEYQRGTSEVVGRWLLGQLDG